MTPSGRITLRRTTDAQGGTSASSRGVETDAQMGRLAKGFGISQREGLFCWREFTVGEMTFRCS
jgi:hypothetical protein